MIEINDELFGVLAVCALRYCQGRQSYMPDLVRKAIRPHLQELTDKDIGVMINDCDYQRRYDIYGDKKIDMPGWLEWEQELIAERERRRSDETTERR